MLRFASRLVLALCLVTLTGSRCLAEDKASVQQPTAGGMLQQAFATLHLAVTSGGPTTNDAVNSKLKGIIFPAFDFAELSKRCVGPAWEQASSEQQKEIATLFSDMLARSFLDLVRAYIKTANLSISDESSKGEHAHVHGIIGYEGDSAKADFWLVQTNGTWRIHNIVVNSFSLEKLYSMQFSPISKAEGITGLISRLRNMTPPA